MPEVSLVNSIFSSSAENDFPEIFAVLMNCSLVYCLKERMVSRLFNIPDWDRSGISDGNDLGSPALGRQRRRSQQIIIRTGYALRAR